MATGKRRREVQAELNARNTRRGRQQENEINQTPKRSKSFFAPLLLLEAILVFGSFYFLGMPIALGLAAVPLLFALIARYRARRAKKRLKGTAIVFLAYLAIVFFCLKTSGMLNTIFSMTQVNQFYVVTLASNDVSTMEEIPVSSTIGLGPETSYQTHGFAKQKFAEDNLEFNYVTYDDESVAAAALLDGTQQYIVVQDINSDQLKEIQGFKTDTKVIKHYKEKLMIPTGSKNVKTEKFNVLITGIDSRSGSMDSTSRSDTVMVASVDPKAQTASIVSIPRDAYVMSTCIGEQDKITHSSLNGISCTIADVEGLLDIEIDYYITVNFYAAIDAIDTLGGIDIDVESSFCGQDVNDKKNAYCLNAGMQHLSGAEALSYARERNSFSDGDYARARHQQQVIDGFIKALATSSPLAITKLLDVSADNARTSLSAGQLSDIAKIIIGSDDFQTEKYTLKGTGSRANIAYWNLYGTSVQVIDEQSLQEAKAMLSDETEQQ